MDLASRLGGQVPPGPWMEPPNTAVVVPIRSNKAHYLAGFLVAGISARLRLDEQYRNFLDLISAQVATVANVRDRDLIGFLVHQGTAQIMLAGHRHRGKDAMATP